MLYYGFAGFNLYFFPAKVLHNVFSDEECDQLIAASEAMGYTEDAPVSLGRHIRKNENCVWIADAEMTREAFQRCLPFLPNGSADKGPVGLNARRGYGDVEALIPCSSPA